METKSALLTPSERDWLITIEKEWQATTPGTWHARATDDDAAMIAQYVSTEPRPQNGEFIHDGRLGLAVGMPDQVDPKQVIAITLHQSTGLALSPQSDENTLFIAHAHQHIPRLFALIRRLDDALAYRGD